MLSGIRNIFLAANFSKEEFSLNFLTTLTISFLLLFDFGSTYRLQNIHNMNDSSTPTNSEEVFAARKYFYIMSMISILSLLTLSIFMFIAQQDLYSLAFFVASIIFPLQYSLNQRLALMIGHGNVLKSQNALLAATIINFLITTILIQHLGLYVILIGPFLGYLTLNLYYWNYPLELDTKASIKFPSRKVKERIMSHKTVGITNFYSFILISIDYVVALVMLNESQSADIAFLMNILTFASVLPITVGNLLIETNKIKYFDGQHAEIQLMIKKTRNLIFCLCILEMNAILIFCNILIPRLLPSYSLSVYFLGIYGIAHILYVSTFYSSNVLFLYDQQHKLKNAFELSGIFWILHIVGLVFFDAVSLEMLLVVAVIRNLTFFILHSRIIYQWGNFRTLDYKPNAYFLTVLLLSQLILINFDWIKFQLGELTILLIYAFTSLLFARKLYINWRNYFRTF
jgi:hypothetical protein